MWRDMLTNFFLNGSCNGRGMRCHIVFTHFSNSGQELQGDGCFIFLFIASPSHSSLEKRQPVYRFIVILPSHVGDHAFGLQDMYAQEGNYITAECIQRIQYTIAQLSVHVVTKSNASSVQVMSTRLTISLS